jgi:hypothetical protein
MAGYAALSPALLGGPPGWVVWAVGGTALTVGAAVVGSQAIQMARTRERAKAEPQAVPNTRACEKTGSVEDCKQRRYTVRVHAQGTDCGGTTGSTIGAPALTQSTPITVAQGLGLSATTWGMLGARQQSVREQAKAKAEDYISEGPASGGRLGQRSFPAADRRGGKRYDVDCFGDGPSFLA